MALVMALWINTRRMFIGTSALYYDKSSCRKNNLSNITQTLFINRNMNSKLMIPCSDSLHADV